MYQQSNSTDASFHGFDIPIGHLSPDLQSDLLTAFAHLCLKSKRLMFPQESIVCSSLPFLFLMEQMERQSLADLGNGNHFLGAVLFFERKH